MKKLLFIIMLMGFTLGCSAENYRYRYTDSDDYYENQYENRHFWRQVNQRLLRQYHLVDENLEHGRLSRQHAHKLYRHINKLENRIEELRCENEAGPYQRRNILRYLDRNEQRINKYLNHRRGKFRYQSRYANPYNTRTYLPNRGIQWSLGGNSGVFYFNY